MGGECIRNLVTNIIVHSYNPDKDAKNILMYFRKNKTTYMP